MSFYGFVYILGFLIVLLPLGRFDFFQRDIWYRVYISVYAAIGAFIGGRIGYVFLYEPSYYLNGNLYEIIEIYKGGMSYHGGVLGIIIAIFLCDKKGFWTNLDKIALISLIIIPLGRIANFFNGELWGTPTSMPWGVVFNAIDSSHRHPVQIYEAICEGPIVACIIYYFGNKIFKKNILQSENSNKIIPGIVSSLYGISYGCLRSITECFREPDMMIGLFPLNLTMGQILSMVMGLISMVIIYMQLREFRVNGNL